MHHCLESEAAFHDESFSTAVPADADRFYSVTVTSERRYQQLAFRMSAGRPFWGMGAAPDRTYLMSPGLETVSSGSKYPPVAIEMATKKASAEGLVNRALATVSQAALPIVRMVRRSARI